MSALITVLIVDDSALIRQMFREILDAEDDIHVIGTASDPLEAREKIKQLNPDVVTLDIEMPRMDGLSFLEKIMALRPMPVIMASSLTQKGADATLRALEIGAFDYVSKPVSNQNRETIGALRDDLLARVRAAARSNVSKHQRVRQVAVGSPVISYTPVVGKPMLVIAIGSSTGGVEALREIFLRLPANCPPVVITQHMPEAFTKSFAARLNSMSGMTIVEATNHQRLQSGHAYIAPGGTRHLKIVKIGTEYVCKLEEGAPVSGHRPSVDVLFQSMAETVGKHAVGVILTGMGKDGAIGMKKMRDAGSYNIAQNEASCVVYGMPRVAVEMNAAHVQLALLDIPRAIIKQCEEQGGVYEKRSSTLSA